MSLYSTYDQVGKAEDVQSVVQNITPLDTPMYTAIRDQKVHARVYEYQTDTIDAPSDNKMAEGSDASASALTPTTMITGNTQILSKTLTLRAAA